MKLRREPLTDQLVDWIAEEGLPLRSAMSAPCPSSEAVVSMANAYLQEG